VKRKVLAMIEDSMYDFGMGGTLGGRVPIQMKLEKAHAMYLRHELRRVQCEHAGVDSGDERVEAERWKRSCEALRGAWDEAQYVLELKKNGQSLGRGNKVAGRGI